MTYLDETFFRGNNTRKYFEGFLSFIRVQKFVIISCNLTVVAPARPGLQSQVCDHVHSRFLMKMFTLNTMIVKVYEHELLTLYIFVYLIKCQCEHAAKHLTSSLPDAAASKGSEIIKRVSQIV